MPALIQATVSRHRQQRCRPGTSPGVAATENTFTETDTHPRRAASAATRCRLACRRSFDPPKRQCDDANVLRIGLVFVAQPAGQVVATEETSEPAQPTRPPGQSAASRTIIALGAN